MEIDCKFISANCNPVYHALTYLKGTSTVAYCAANQVLLHDTSRLNTTGSLNMNRKCDCYAAEDPGRCNCLTSYQSATHGYIVAGYESGDIAVFECPKDQYQDHTKWRLASRTKQNASIIFIELLEHQNNVLLATINNKASCSIIQVLKDISLKEAFCMNFPLSKIPQSICLFPVGSDNLVLAVGGMDQHIHLYAALGGTLNFEYATSLKGHENALTKLTAINANGELLLASASKDGYIRVWKVTPTNEVPNFQRSRYALFGDLSIYLESILIAHECSVTNLVWSTRLTRSPLTLVSTSTDCTVGVWQRDESGVWLVRYRLGQLYGNKNAFFSLMINEDSSYIMTANFTGASCVWQYQTARDGFESLPSFSGHFSTVADLAWNHTNDFLVSCSKDQTTRVYCQHRQTNIYHEISRAQIHGYDINTVAVVPIGDKMIDLIACGADEKVIRIIEPTSSTANLLNCHTHANLHLYFENQAQEKSYLVDNKDWLEYQTLSEGGTQVLGLMTKAQRVERQKITNYYEGDEEEEPNQEEGGQATTNVSANVILSKPPTQDFMVKHTLWPEMNKLYGHPYELMSLCVGKGVMASSCHSLNSESAFIVVWDLKTWKILHQLQHHKSTVNALKYSPDGRYLAAVSKDRSLSVYLAEQNYKIKFFFEAHTRAVTACDISADNRVLATVSRDKTLKLHSIAEGKQFTEYKLKSAAYSVAFHPDGSLIACGTEDGTIVFLKLTEHEGIKEVTRIPNFIGHSKLVSKLCWAQRGGKVLLASCSHDHTVRVYEVRLLKE